MKLFSISALASLSLAVLLSTFCGCGDNQKGKKDAEVLANLQTAYNGESNASAKYAMYAAEAKKAGYEDISNLFLAASRAEGIHAENEAKVIRQLGAEPQRKIELPKYESVEASLKDAIAGETYEYTTMYPGFIATAEANGSSAAANAFRWANEAEKEHAAMYKDALDNMEQYKSGDKAIYVCTVCGYTTTDPITVCVLCASPKEKFETFGGK